MNTVFSSDEFLKSFAAALQRHGAEAGDLFGESYLRLCDPTVSSRYDPSRGSPLRFALGIAHRIQKEMARKERRASRTVEITDQVASTEGGPLDAVLAEERRSLARAAVKSLDVSSRRLLIRRYGFETTRADEEPMTATERCRLHRVRAQLRRWLMDLE